MFFLTSTPSLILVEPFSANSTEKDGLLELETGKKSEEGRNSSMELLHPSRKDSADVEVEELGQIKFLELLALNLPDWYLVLLGVIFSVLFGIIFPLIAVIFSGVLEVGRGLKYIMTIIPSIAL